MVTEDAKQFIAMQLPPYCFLFKLVIIYSRQFFEISQSAITVFENIFLCPTTNCLCKN